MHSRHFLPACLAIALVLLAKGLATAQSVPGISEQPVEEIDNPLLPATGEESREFAVGELKGAAVSLGGNDPVGAVEAVVQGLDEQIGFVVATNDRVGSQRILPPISDVVVRNDRLILGYSLTPLRALLRLHGTRSRQSCADSRQRGHQAARFGTGSRYPGVGRPVKLPSRNFPRLADGTIREAAC